MCGIFAYLGGNLSWKELRDHAYKIKYRGPENTHIAELNNNAIFAFHRLAIMGVSETGDQPMQHPQDPSLTLICNGEIYNYLELADKFGFILETGSDCEIILFLYKKFGIEQTVRELDGVFMFVLYDDISKTFYAGRDPMGVRPGFIGNKGEELFITSEAKPMVGVCDSIQPFPPGCWWSSQERDSFHRYFHYSNDGTAIGTEDEICDRICELLSSAVEKRMMAEREISCLLSGGLDSSLITALVARHSNGNTLKTYSIGMPGSIDLEYAQRAADYIGTIHHHIEVTEEDFLEAIETVIYNIESYDTTTVRASVGNYLVSRFIRENSDCKVVFNGDGSDEVCCGYVYLKNAPSADALQQESERLVKELYLFDVLRSDRSISSNGLEARTPFLDKAFVKYYLSIPAKLKMFDGEKRLEKHLLRKAFDRQDLLPHDILWRRKCAFSDGVSSASKSWHRIIQNYVDTIISDEEFIRESVKINHCRPVLKESYFYRKVYQQFFGEHDELIPHYWLPKWTDTVDPSARELAGYKE